MSHLTPLFPEEGASSKLKNVLLIGLFAGISAAVLGIAYFGLGPMLAPPTKSVVSAPKDVAEVLGTQPSADFSQQWPVLDQTQTQQVLGRLRQKIDTSTYQSVVMYILPEQSIPQDQFFAQAQAGDLFVIFNPGQQALLYRPSQDKILQAGQLTN